RRGPACYANQQKGADASRPPLTLEEIKSRRALRRLNSIGDCPAALAKMPSPREKLGREFCVPDAAEIKFAIDPETYRRRATSTPRRKATASACSGASRVASR